MKYNYKYVISGNNKRYYKQVSGKWKRITNKAGQKAQKWKRVFRSNDGDSLDHIENRTYDIKNRTDKHIGDMGEELNKIYEFCMYVKSKLENIKCGNEIYTTIIKNCNAVQKTLQDFKWTGEGSGSMYVFDEAMWRGKHLKFKYSEEQMTNRFKGWVYEPLIKKHNRIKELLCEFVNNNCDNDRNKTIEALSGDFQEFEDFYGYSLQSCPRPQKFKEMSRRGGSASLSRTS